MGFGKMRFAAMSSESPEQHLAERIRELEDGIRQLKKLIVQKYGTPWWQARSENVDFEQFYTCMLAKAQAKSDDLKAEPGKLPKNPKRTKNYRAGRHPAPDGCQEGE
jgi:hypothetical protein